MMSTAQVTVALPAEVYAQLEELAVQEAIQPVDMIERLVTTAQQQRAWQRDLVALRQDIQQNNNAAHVAHNPTIEELRQTRSDIFDAEYAHLYR
jgi:hypothetical protein